MALLSISIMGSSLVIPQGKELNYKKMFHLKLPVSISIPLEAFFPNNSQNLENCSIEDMRHAENINIVSSYWQNSCFQVMGQLWPVSKKVMRLLRPCKSDLIRQGFGPMVIFLYSAKISSIKVLITGEQSGTIDGNIIFKEFYIDFS